MNFLALPSSGRPRSNALCTINSPSLLTMILMKFFGPSMHGYKEIKDNGTITQIDNEVAFEAAGSPDLWLSIVSA